MASTAAHTNTKTTVAILGCGDLGARLADQLPASHFSVVGLRRRHLPATPDIEYRSADMQNAAALSSALPSTPEVIVMTPTPSARTDEGYQQAYVGSVQALLDYLQGRQPPQLILFASSTGVYGQQQGEWVDEASATEPTGFTGRRLLEAEELLQNSEFNSCVIRFAGIYGPGRQRMIQQVSTGKISPAEPPVYGNRIHADDCAAVFTHIITLHQTSQHPPNRDCYVACDSDPATLHTVHHWVADQLGVSQAQRYEADASDRGSKRCSNHKLLTSGFQLRYSSYQQGYPPIIAEYLAHAHNR